MIYKWLNGQCVALLLLDLSAAFDTVHHEILLRRLCSRFGIKLTDRTQSVQIDGITSSDRPLSYRVPWFRAGTDTVSIVYFSVG